MVEEGLSLSGLSEKNIADGWRKLGTVDFTSFFRAYTGYSRQFSLNDWGNYQLLKYASMQLYPSFSPRERTLFLFYALSNAGYKAKIGRVEKDVLVLLLPFAEEVYKLPFIKAGEEKYYVMDISSKQLKKLYSIMADFPKAEKVLSLHISEALDFGYEEYFFSGDRCFIEWPEMVEPLLPENTLICKFSELADGRRELVIEEKL